MNTYEKQSSTGIGPDEQGEEKETVIGGITEAERELCESERESMAEEEWRDIIGYEGLYKVSSIGRIINKHNNFLYGISWWNCCGYCRIILTNNKKQKTFFIHRLVALAFIPNPHNLPQIDHINRIRHDNRMINLRWVTSYENNLNKTNNIYYLKK